MHRFWTEDNLEWCCVVLVDSDCSEWVVVCVRVCVYVCCVAWCNCFQNQVRLRSWLAGLLGFDWGGFFQLFCVACLRNTGIKNVHSSKRYMYIKKVVLEAY